jgi:hypothetical protein
MRWISNLLFHAPVQPPPAYGVRVQLAVVGEGVSWEGVVFAFVVVLPLIRTPMQTYLGLLTHSHPSLLCSKVSLLPSTKSVSSLPCAAQVL